jgi:hypothetical protein
MRLFNRSSVPIVPIGPIGPIPRTTSLRLRPERVQTFSRRLSRSSSSRMARIGRMSDSVIRGALFQVTWNFMGRTKQAQGRSGGCASSRRDGQEPFAAGHGQARCLRRCMIFELRDGIMTSSGVRPRQIAIAMTQPRKTPVARKFCQEASSQAYSLCHSVAKKGQK